MIFKDIKVLCVIKRNSIYTRVVKQDPATYENYDEREEWGPLTIRAINTPELRPYEDTLFVRGNQRCSDHRCDKYYSNPEEIQNIKLRIEQANQKYHELSIQNPTCD